MKRLLSVALGWSVLLVAPAAMAAGTIEEDEARLEALLQAQRAARAAKAAEAAAAARPAAQARERGADAAWLAPAATPAGLPFAELARHVGERVTILTSGERRHRGVVQAADGRRVTLRVHRPGGAATYSLPRNQIVRIDLR